MFKKIIAMLLVTGIVLSLTSCYSRGNSENQYIPAIGDSVSEQNKIQTISFADKQFSVLENNYVKIVPDVTNITEPAILKAYDTKKYSVSLTDGTMFDDALRVTVLPVNNAKAPYTLALVDDTGNVIFNYSPVNGEKFVDVIDLSPYVGYTLYIQNNDAKDEAFNVTVQSYQQNPSPESDAPAVTTEEFPVSQTAEQDTDVPVYENSTAEPAVQSDSFITASSDGIPETDVTSEKPEPDTAISN